MIEHMTEMAFDGKVVPTKLQKKSKGLWTPWGPQRVPDLDRALESSRPLPPRQNRGDAADVHDYHQWS